MSQNLQMLTKNVKEITDNSKLLRSVQSHRTVQAAQHPDFNHLQSQLSNLLNRSARDVENIPSYAFESHAIINISAYSSSPCNHSSHSLMAHDKF